MNDRRDVAVPDPEGDPRGPVPDRRTAGPFAGAAGDEWAASPEEGVDWGRLFSAVRRYRWWSVLVVVLGTGLGAVVAREMQPEYVAEATLWVDWSRRDRAGPAPIESGELLHSYNWVDLVESYAVLEHATREQRLYVRPRARQDHPLFASFGVEETYRPGEYELAVSPDGRTFRLTREEGIVVQEAHVGATIGLPAGFLWTPPVNALTPGRTIAFEVLPLRDAARELGQALQPRMLENGNFLHLELSGSDPAHAAAVLNTIAERTVELARDLKGAKAEELESLLDDQLRSAEGKLREAEAALEAFLEGAIPGTASVAAGGEDAAPNPLADRYIELRVELDQLREDLVAIETALTQARKGTLPVELLETIPAVRGSRELDGALQEVAELRAERRALGARYTDEHPDARRLADRAAALEQVTVPTLLGRLAGQLEQRAALVETELAETGAELRQIPERTTSELRLRRALLGAENLYTALRARYEEARLATASTVPDVRILDPAEVPTLPVSDERRRVMLLALLGSMALAIGGVVLVDRMDPRVRYPQQVSYEMGLPILGMVPRLKTRRGRYDDDDATRGVEAFRAIRLGLTSAFGSAGPIMVAITSPGPGEGKSFVSLNLALTYADMGLRTLLVDGDTRRGGLHRPLSVPRKPGLTDYLAGEATIIDVIRPTGDRSPDLLACGTRMQRGPELLTGRSMRHLLASIRSEYDVILVDTPPLGAGVDPLILAGFTGHLLLVLRAGTTNRAHAGAHLEPIRALPVRLLGAVLNDVPAGGTYHYYHYLPDYAARDEGEARAPTRLLPT